MRQFFIDKTSKVPIYLQLKDQVKYFVATGSLLAQERLPPVKALAQSLSINFLTVRKAYKELESEGLLEVRQGDGTFVALSRAIMDRQPLPSRGSSDDAVIQLQNVLESEVARFEAIGVGGEELIGCLEQLLDSVRRRANLPIVVFTECNQFQISEISELLKNELGMDVIATLTEKLDEVLSELVNKGRPITVVTTGFHVNEVRAAIHDRPIEMNVLITNLNPQTRRTLESVGEKGKFSFICRDRESTLMYKDLLKSELGFSEIDMTSCTIYETKKVREALRSSDAVLASPPVFDAVRAMAPRGVSIYNVFERVDPMSLRVIKDRILSPK